MAHFEYELDEFQPFPGLAVYVYGEATITYQWEGRDRDTGDGAGPYDIEVESIEIGPDLAKDKKTPIDRKHPLWDAIEKQLCESRHVVAACISDYEGWES